MPKGRPSKTAAEHKAKGSYKECRHGGQPEDVEPLATDDAPPGLDDAAQAEWMRVKPLLAWAGEVDRELVKGYCRAVSMQAYWLDIWTAGIGTPNDMMKIQRSYLQASDNMQRLAAAIGIGPANRAKVKAPEAPAAKDPVTVKLENMLTFPKKSSA